MLLMLDSAEELALEGFVRGNRSTESFGLVGKRVFAETSEDSVVGWGFPEGVCGFLGEDLSVEGDPSVKEGSTEETTEEATAGEVSEEETTAGEVFEEEPAEEAPAEEETAEEAPAGYSSEMGGWGEVFSQFRKGSGVIEETPGVSGMEFEDVEEVEDEDEFEDTEDEDEGFEDTEEDESEDTEDEDEFEDVEEVEDEDEEEEFEDAEEDDPTEVVEFALDDTSSGGEEEEVEEGSTDEYSVEEEPSGYSGGLEFEDVEEVDDADEDTEEYVEDTDEDTGEEEDANTSPSPVEVVRTPKSREVTSEEVSKPKKPTHKLRKRLSRQDAPYAPSTPQEPRPASQEAKPKSQKGRLKKPSTNTHTFDTPKRSPGIRRLEPIPATVREYVMANPDVCYNDVVKLYSLKQIKKELALGRIYRSGNKLGV